MPQFANARHKVSAGLGQLSGRMSRGLQRRLGANIVSDVLARVQKNSFSSRSYWEQRYQTGGNSGAGSFGQIAEFKASVLNALVREKKIESVIELGCGDGNQFERYSFPSYKGFDVSLSAVELCRKRFQMSEGMSFHRYPEDFRKMVPVAALSLSIDVLFHLVEEKVFKAHLRDLFNSAERYAVIFSTAFDQSYDSAHQIDRDFRNYIVHEFPEFALEQTIENPYKGAESQADFFIYRRRDA